MLLTVGLRNFGASFKTNSHRTPLFPQTKHGPDDSYRAAKQARATQQFGARNIPYISPERVQDSTWVRVLIAKDAISTGWDCPRAEVMVSFRAAVDRTHITQLLGRIV